MPHFLFQVEDPMVVGALEVLNALDGAVVLPSRLIEYHTRPLTVSELGGAQIGNCAWALVRIDQVAEFELHRGYSEWICWEQWDGYVQLRAMCIVLGWGMCVLD